MAMASFSLPASLALSAPDSDGTLRSELQRISTKRIYFAHQSVGGNLLDGIQQIAEAQNYPLQIREYSVANEVPSQTLGHTRIGENGNPLGKIKAFTQALGQPPSGLNIALLKFCYVDFTRDTDAKALFTKYKVDMDHVKSRHPKLTLVHVTVPLTTVQSGLKGTVKQWLGIAPYGLLENKRREEYNDLLRSSYLGREFVFDLAKVESTTRSGTRTLVKWKGDSVPMLNPSYTDDGQHLNAEGRIYAARHLISVLAQIP